MHTEEKCTNKDNMSLLKYITDECTCVVCDNISLLKTVMII
jgi:hypothetical protein